MTKPRFVYVVYIQTTPQKLWDALTKPEFTKLWWNETYQDTTWKPGSSWKLMIPDGRVADAGEIIESDPPRKLVLRWQNQFTELRAEGFSICTITLDPGDTAVKLTVVHEMESDRPESTFISKVSNGWPMILSSLKSLLETGNPLEATRKWPKGM